MYADLVTASMQQAIDETQRRREIQGRYNRDHNIQPQTIQKDISSVFESLYEKEPSSPEPNQKVKEQIAVYQSADEVDTAIANLESQMQQAAKNLEFEIAADLRDQIKRLRKMQVFVL
jgi:excinuclease ABC subunit B